MLTRCATIVLLHTRRTPFGLGGCVLGPILLHQLAGLIHDVRGSQPAAMQQPQITKFLIDLPANDKVVIGGRTQEANLHHVHHGCVVLDDGHHECVFGIRELLLPTTRVVEVIHRDRDKRANRTVKAPGIVSAPPVGECVCGYCVFGYVCCSGTCSIVLAYMYGSV